MVLKYLLYPQIRLSNAENFNKPYKLGSDFNNRLFELKKYVLEFDEIANLPIERLEKLIQSTPGILLSDLKLYDLAYTFNRRIFPGIGVYIFRRGDEVMYVGKCSSCSFIERIPKHFDSRKVAWFHRLLEIIAVKVLGETEITDNTLSRASDYAFQEYNLILISFQISDKPQIGQFEKLLRISLNPLNRFKTKRLKDSFMPISEYLSSNLSEN